MADAPLRPDTFRLRSSPGGAVNLFTRQAVRARPRPRLRRRRDGQLPVPRSRLRRRPLPRRHRARRAARRGPARDPPRAEGRRPVARLRAEQEHALAGDPARRRALRLLGSRPQGRVHARGVPARAARGRLRADRTAHARRARHAVGGGDRRRGRALARALRPPQPLEARGRAAPAGREHRVPRGGEEALMAVLGLLPSIRGGLGELARTGQHSRLIDGYLRPYARAFEEVRYFSYLDESLADFSADAELLARVRVLPGGGWHPWLYAFVLPFRHRRALAACDVVRVFQVTGVIPALVARRLYGVPFVTTYGFWYGTP